jgi:hypothetical protein
LEKQKQKLEKPIFPPSNYPPPTWNADPEELKAVKSKIQENIRAREGRDIDLDSIDVNSAKTGETTIGKLVYESEDEIVLDTNPCRDEMSHFRKPYVKESTNRTARCGGKSFELFVVEQK